MKFKIRLPKEYLEKYKLGVYDNALKHWNECIEEICSIRINYPVMLSQYFIFI